MVTDAEVIVRGRSAELRKDGKSLVVHIESPKNGVFEVASTTPPKPQNQNSGTRKLVVRLPEKVSAVKLHVRFEDVR